MSKTEIRAAVATDASALHALAAATFPLACPPATTRADMDEFIATQLSEASFAGYLGDPDRALFVAEVDDVAVGYTMVIFREPSDQDVAAAISLHPSAELSKVYVLESQHGTGLAARLVEISVEAARGRGAAGIWLGVNSGNARANRFYEKSGFALVGTRRFLVGDTYEDDFVRERPLTIHSADTIRTGIFVQ